MKIEKGKMNFSVGEKEKREKDRGNERKRKQ